MIQQKTKKITMSVLAIVIVKNKKKNEFLHINRHHYQQCQLTAAATQLALQAF
jgi:hypothetical protein